MIHRRLHPVIALVLIAFAAGCAVAPDAPTDETLRSSDDALTRGGNGNFPPIPPIPPRGGDPGTVTLKQPTVAVSHVTALQPGWVRVSLEWTIAGGDLAFDVTPTCAAGTDPSSVKVTAGAIVPGAHTAYVDLRANLAWLADHSLPLPCHVTGLDVAMRRSGSTIATSTAPRDFAIDLPLSHLTPAQLVSPIAGASVDLHGARRWAAYPPRIVAVRSATGRVAFLEVEELAARGTLGLRSLSAFDGGSLAFELAAGAEISPSWGVDVDGRGVTKPTSGVEESHPGVVRFTTSTPFTPSMMSTPSLKVLPAAPLWDDATYLANVLDNQGLPRVLQAKDDLDVIYDALANVLRAVNGATIVSMEGAPLEGFTLIDRVPLPDITEIVPVAGHGGVAMTPRMLHVPGGHPDIDAVEALSGSVATLLAPQVQPGNFQRPVSPEESAIAVAVIAPLVHPKASCVLSADKKMLTSKVSTCDGWTTSGCPTVADPLRPEALSPSTAKRASAVPSLTPYPMGRDNYLGTCGTHAITQQMEAVLNKFMDDEGKARVAMVDGQPIAIPEPRIGLSESAMLAHRYTWMGTKADNTSTVVDPDPARWPTLEQEATFPMFAEGYMPAREGNFFDWVEQHPEPATAKSYLASCKTNYWFSGFCFGQGTDTPGVYRQYSTMVKSAGQDPLREGLWSLAGSYMPFVHTWLSMADRDAAIQEVMAEVRGGVPVQMAFASALSARKDGPPSPAGGGGMTWYLPPEVAACDLGSAWDIGGGHYANIVGYTISGTASAPDPFNSYFLVQNNWGKGAGYKGFYAMNFAYFKALAYELHTYRLDRKCASSACARGLIELPIGGFGGLGGLGNLGGRR